MKKTNKTKTNKQQNPTCNELCLDVLRCLTRIALYENEAKTNVKY